MLYVGEKIRRGVYEVLQEFITYGGGSRHLVFTVFGLRIPGSLDELVN